jgi:tetratricopeptide (TPR) repeat protein
MTRFCAPLCLFFLAACISSHAHAQKEKKTVVVNPATLKLSFPELLVLENKKRTEYKEKYYVLPKNQKEGNRSKAELYYKKGRSYFDSGDANLAQRYYEKAVSLNPFIDMYYYELAIACYRNNKFTKSLVYLEMVSGSGIDTTEIQYYEALNYMKMSETNNAIRTFGYVIEKNDPTLSPSAAMYKGLLLKQNKKYDQAQESFQYVLDTAKDVALDKKAEQQIDEILAIKRFEEESKRHFSYAVFTGFMYDSNVLNVANNNSSLDLEAYRLMYGGNFEYKAIHNMKHTLSARLSASDLYSVDNSFATDATIQSTDPLQAELSVPYNYRFAMFKRASSLTLTPSYSNIFMSLDEQSRELVYSTIALGTELSMSAWDKWLNGIRLDVASDTFHPETTAINDQSALKYSLTLSNVRVLDNTGKKSFSIDLNYINNNADGDNSFYDRYLASIGGTYPASENWITYGKIDYIIQEFSKSDSDRSDKGMIATLGGVYSISSKLNLNVYVQYQDNQSNVALYDFNKISAMTMISYSSGFF